MNTEHLAYILEIHRCQSINQAAKTLFISQPSLSSLLKTVEAEIGYKIFERTSTGIHPTEQGEVFLRFARRVRDEYTSVCHSGQPLRESDNLSISIACSSLYSRAFFEYKNAYPVSGVTSDVLCESTTDGSLQNIIANRTRIAITYYGYRHAAKYEKYAHKNGLAYYPLVSEMPVKVVVAKNHPLVREGAVNFHELSTYPFLAYYDEDYEDTLGIVGTPDDIDIQYITSRASYYDAISTGKYISVSMDFAPGEAERLGLVLLPCENYGDHLVTAYFTKIGYVQSAREAGFIEFLRNTILAHQKGKAQS